MCVKIDAGNPRNYFFRTNFVGRSPKFEKKGNYQSPTRMHRKKLLSLSLLHFENYFEQNCGDNKSAKKKHPALSQLKKNYFQNVVSHHISRRLLLLRLLPDCVLPVNRGGNLPVGLLHLRGKNTHLTQVRKTEKMLHYYY